MAQPQGDDRTIDARLQQLHAQQTVLSTLLGVLGYVPTMSAD
ncbi:transcriptional repressor TraM [Bradyrhizobium septentrionale]